MRINTSIYPTEDPGRVMAALKKMFVFSDAQVQQERKTEVVSLKIDVSIRYEVEVTRVVIETNDRLCLEKLQGLFRDEYIQECARSVLYSSRTRVEGNATKVSFKLHKQAAYIGVVHFSELHESPLGPINVDIITDDFEEFVNWFAPRETMAKGTKPDACKD
nr:RNA-binding domain-containing protein [Candidatus Sigynarchaeota archaeon]